MKMGSSQKNLCPSMIQGQLHPNTYGTATNRFAMLTVDGFHLNKIKRNLLYNIQSKPSAFIACFNTPAHFHILLFPSPLLYMHTYSFHFVGCQ